jgi:hypothetical protein
MRKMSRRAFLAISASGLCVSHYDVAAFAAPDSRAIGLPMSAHAELSNALNLRLFLKNTDAVGLAGVMSMRAVEGQFGKYSAATLVLFPFKRTASSADMPAFLPGAGATDPPHATVAMTSHGFSPDEYFCRYVLKTPLEDFIGFELGARFAPGFDNRPWRSNIALGDAVVGARWSSSNLNDRWFAGSRWIPDNDHGKAWRDRIVDGLRRAAAIAG